MKQHFASHVEHENMHVYLPNRVRLQKKGALFLEQTHGNMVSRGWGRTGGVRQLTSPSMGLPYATIPGPAHASGLRVERGVGRTTAPNPPLGHSDVARQQVTARVIAGRTGPSLLGPASWGVKLPERAAEDRR